MGYTLGISGNYTREAQKLSIPLKLSVSQSMADFYLLERLEADGSTRAKRELDTLEKALAPVFVTYLGAICLGEMRHVYNASEAGESDMLSCGCHCWDCHNEGYSEHDHQYDNCEPTIWSSYETDCKEEESLDPSDHEDCCGTEATEWDCGLMDGDESYECGDDDPYETSGMGDSDAVPAGINEFMEGYDRSDRTGCWRGWAKFSLQHGTVQALDMLYRGFSEIQWEGGYGGSAWATIARCTRDYANHKISRRVFINMVWSMQHNGGNVFNKMWTHDDCSKLQRLLEQQSQDNYNVLSVAASVGARSIWRVRSYMMNGHNERDDVWLGVQRTFTSDEGEW